MGERRTDINTRFKSHLQRHNIKYTYLSEKSGVSISTICKIANGQSSGEIDILIKLAKALGLEELGVLEMIIKDRKEGRYKCVQKPSRL